MIKSITDCYISEHSLSPSETYTSTIISAMADHVASQSLSFSYQSWEIWNHSIFFIIQRSFHTMDTITVYITGNVLHNFTSMSHFSCACDRRCLSCTYEFWSFASKLFVSTALPCGLVSFTVPPVYTGLSKSHIALQSSTLPCKYEFCNCRTKLWR